MTQLTESGVRGSLTSFQSHLSEVVGDHYEPQESLSISRPGLLVGLFDEVELNLKLFCILSEVKVLVLV